MNRFKCPACGRYQYTSNDEAEGCIYCAYKGPLELMDPAGVEKTGEEVDEQLQAQLDEWKYEAKCHMDEVIAREKQIEQLQAQAARMREALRKAREAIKAAWSDGSANAAMDKASEALAAIDKAIGGREDVTSMGD
jgi:predicted  nucleic acid-binding Zn-ribbon protein